MNRINPHFAIFVGNLALAWVVAQVINALGGAS